MCGICGIIYRDIDRPVEKRLLYEMSQKIVHRGPDDDGYFLEKNMGMAMKRLSIIDIAGGKQPIYNEDESIVTVYNGEIYNYLVLREELKAKGHIFKTNSDTEILVHLYEEYGRNLLDHLNGMFAFAIYDRKHHQLMIARDRLGIKPLYYIEGDDWFLFSSEIKSFMGFPEFKPVLDLEALHHYLTFRFVPAPMTLFKGVRKLPPGFFIDYHFSRKNQEPTQYWDLTFGPGERLWSKPDSVVAVRDLLHDAVKIRLMSEVPLGVMLSGGVDSSAIVSSMKSANQSNTSSFTITYEEEGAHNEGVFAKIAAEAFQTDHHEITVRLDDFIGNLEKMVYFMDEPIADPAAMPIYELCRFSKEYVTVLLAGVGGDELFAGYNVYKEAIYSGYLRRVPRFVWNGFILPLYGLMPEGVPGKNFVGRVNCPLEDVFLGSSVNYGGFSEAQKTSLYTDDFAEQQKDFNSHDIIRQTLERVPQASRLHKMMYVDTKHWLADSHLIMMDKMSMAHSMELRTPLLDHRMVELAATIPEKLKMNLSRSKIVFKNAFMSEIPGSIINRPKRGFSTPINLWINRFGHELSDMLLNQKSLTRDIFMGDKIKQLFNNHKRGIGDFSASIFTLLIFDIWQKTFLKNY